MAGRINAYRLLARMPMVFDLRELELETGVSHEYAITLAWRWRRQNLISGFAEEVYFNVFRDERVRETHLRTAVEMALQQPHLKIGLSALHEAGWTTQIDRKPEFAVMTTHLIRSWKKLDHVTVEGRGTQWFDAAWAASYEGTGGFRYLDPAYALVDSIMARQRFAELPKSRKAELWKRNAVIWHPAPDDLSIDEEPDEVVGRIAEAAAVLKADTSVVEDYVRQIEGLEDECGHFSGPKEARGRAVR